VRCIAHTNLPVRLDQPYRVAVEKSILNRSPFTGARQLQAFQASILDSVGPITLMASAALAVVAQIALLLQ